LRAEHYAALRDQFKEDDLHRRGGMLPPVVAGSIEAQIRAAMGLDANTPPPPPPPTSPVIIYHIISAIIHPLPYHTHYHNNDVFNDRISYLTLVNLTKNLNGPLICSNNQVSQ
jgi:hypothetical protein